MGEIAWRMADPQSPRKALWKRETGENGTAATFSNRSIRAAIVRPSFSTFQCKTLNNFSKVCYSPLVFDKFRQRLSHGPALPRSDDLSLRSIQAISFQTITHYFARRPTPIPFSFNHFRTLLTAMEGVPSLPSDFEQFWWNVSSLESTPTEASATIDSKPLTQTLNPLDATLTKNTGWGSNV